MARRNPGIPYDEGLIHKSVCETEVHDYVKKLNSKRTLTKENEIASLLQAVTCLDLTTLSADDTESRVRNLCLKAAQPISKDVLEKLGMANEDIQASAVCVYPAHVINCKRALQSVGSDVHIASVAGGFPSGQYHLKSRLLEIELAVADGATEIDIVINRGLALCGKWEEVYKEVKAMRAVCGDNAIMKTILATGELGSLCNVYTASVVCMMAGSDFIKTSTGKETVNATLPVGVVMVKAIKDYFEITGYKVGLKPAGGISTVEDVLAWQFLVEKVLGKEWLLPDLFRIGASRLLTNIEEYLSAYVEQ